MSLDDEVPELSMMEPLPADAPPSADVTRTSPLAVPTPAPLVTFTAPPVEVALPPASMVTLPPLPLPLLPTLKLMGPPLLFREDPVLRDKAPLLLASLLPDAIETGAAGANVAAARCEHHGATGTE